MADQLVDFIRSRKEKVSGPDLNWEAKRDAWVSSVENLYRQIQEMLRDSIASNDLTAHTHLIEVTEDFIGSYFIPALELKVGRERVEFRPKGVTIIGAEGRVDIRGERDSVTLLKDVVNADSGRSVITQRVPHLKTVQFDRDSLTYVLERVMLP